MTLSTQIRDDIAAHWRRSERPTTLRVQKGLVEVLAAEYGSTDPWAVHWLLFGMQPIEDPNLEKKWKITHVPMKRSDKKEELFGSTRG